MTGKTKPCRHCYLSIHEKASVCIHCQRSQSSIESKLSSGAGLINALSIILSIFLVVLSWLQFNEASKQRQSADSAVQSAENALQQANSAREDVMKASVEAKVAKIEAERANVETRNTVEHLRTNIKLLMEMEAWTPSIVDESYDPVKVGKVRQKLEEFAVPDEKERKKWQKSLK